MDAREDILARIGAALTPAPAPVTVPREYLTGDAPPGAPRERDGADAGSTSDGGAGSQHAASDPDGGTGSQHAGSKPDGDPGPDGGSGGAGTGPAGGDDGAPPASAAVVDLLVDRLVDYRATVRRCAPGEVAVAVAEALAGTQVLVVPPGLPEPWLSGYSGEVRRDGDPDLLAVADLDAPGVSTLTGCAVAIAQTGTLVLDTGAGQGRRVLTLVPDHHVCVVHSRQVVAGVPAGLARLPDPTRPLTFVSGPSATSDIELNRVEGVHGPRRLAVIVVDEPAG